MQTYCINCKTGNDNNDGLSSKTAWKTFKNCANIEEGSRVYVASGEYRSPEKIVDKLHLIGTGSPDIIINDRWSHQNTRFNEIVGFCFLQGFCGKTGDYHKTVKKSMKQGTTLFRGCMFYSGENMSAVQITNEVGTVRMERCLVISRNTCINYPYNSFSLHNSVFIITQGPKPGRFILGGKTADEHSVKYWDIDSCSFLFDSIHNNGIFYCGSTRKGRIVNSKNNTFMKSSSPFPWRIDDGSKFVDIDLLRISRGAEKNSSIIEHTPKYSNLNGIDYRYRYDDIMRELTKESRDRYKKGKQLHIILQK